MSGESAPQDAASGVEEMRDEIPPLEERFHQAVLQIESEINLIWSVLELPWWRRMGRRGREWALVEMYGGNPNG